MSESRRYEGVALGRAFSTTCSETWAKGSLRYEIFDRVETIPVYGEGDEVPVNGDLFKAYGRVGLVFITREWLISNGYRKVEGRGIE